MFKFISGEHNNGKGLSPYIVLVKAHDKITHVELMKKLNLERIAHAGYVDISETGFLSFYGSSVTINANTKGIDRLKLNEYIKTHPFFCCDGPLLDIFICNLDILNLVRGTHLWEVEDYEYSGVDLRDAVFNDIKNDA